MTKPPTREAEKWLEDYGDALYRYALMRVRSQTTAEDLVQDTLLAGIQSIHSFSGKSSVQTWLISILKHKMIDHFRKSQKETTAFFESDIGNEFFSQQFEEDGHWKIAPAAWEPPDDTLENEQFWQVYRQCLSNLPGRMADLFLLRSMEGLSSEDCCKIFNFKSTNQLWVTLSRTRMKLRLCLETHWFNKE